MEDEDAALVPYQAGVTALIAAARDNPTGDSVARLLRGIETQRNRVAVAEHALIAEAESQGVAHEHACPTTANWLSQLLRISPPEATARVRAATEPTPPHSSESHAPGH